MDGSQSGDGSDDQVDQNSADEMSDETQSKQGDVRQPKDLTGNEVCFAREDSETGSSDGAEDEAERREVEGDVEECIETRPVDASSIEEDERVEYFFTLAHSRSKFNPPVSIAKYMYVTSY